MLDKNTLSQLQSLKQEIHNSIPRFKGRVRATSGRFGFVNTDEGEAYFLAPEEMDKVLPGDRIDFRVETTSDDKQQAIVEGVESSELKSFFGRYTIRGKGHFIEPDQGSFKRWMFVPPAQRKGAQEGDLVRAHLHLHPFPEGKTQAAIDERIGNIDDARIEQRYTIAKWQLAQNFSQAALSQAQQLADNGLEALLANRTDLSHLPFVTIDSASTRDLDDALFAEAQSEGWNLWIAIADPAAVIEPNSALDQEAYARSSSAYFPELVLPMLPAEISEQLCSLQAEQLRPALVVELRIAEDGSIRQTHLHLAKIASQAKLSYTQVSQFINGENNDLSAELHGPLLHLHNCAQALSQWRASQALVMEDRPDYKLVFDPQGKVQDIVCLERTAAHRLVEECMLACNLAVATWLAEQQSGFFIEHAGIRSERLNDLNQLLAEQLAQPDLNLQVFAQFVQALQQCAHSNSALPLRAIVSRQLERSNLSLEAKPHYGLGFPYYTSFTSPLRKYNDLLIHRLVKSLLANQTAELPSADTLSHIQSQQADIRTAALQAEGWLKLNWLEQQPKEQLYQGKLLHLNATQFIVRLEQTGIEGVIDRRHLKGWNFDHTTLVHSKGEERFILGQEVQVKVKDVLPQSRQLQLELA